MESIVLCPPVQSERPMFASMIELSLLQAGYWPAGEPAEADVELCAALRCEACHRTGMAAVAYRREGKYRCVAVCKCGHGIEV